MTSTSYKRITVDEKIKIGTVLWANAVIQGTHMEQDTYIPCEVTGVTREDGECFDERDIVCVEARLLHSQDCLFFHSSKDFSLAPALFRKEVG